MEARGVFRLCMRNRSQHSLKLQIENRPTPIHTEKENTLTPKNPINAILDTLASQQRQGETSLTVRIEPDLIQDAMNIPGYRKLFAPVIPGLTDTAPIYASYEQMRAGETKHTILVLVECQTIGEFREALGRLPIRKSSEWRSFSTTGFDSSY
jgi:hypothetical protein